jgi:crotonobetainyl-CoA:carnitine CoA-transferase CaiB-like acyl-CoA transferase
MMPLDNLQVVSLAVNLPGPIAAARLRDLGAMVTKVEPPGGDQLVRASRGWYQELSRGMKVVTLDLKAPEGRAGLDPLLETADLLITSSRPEALDRLGLGWDILHPCFPRLCQVAIVGFPPPNENVAGHDLTYQARAGLLNSMEMPRALIADLGGAERAVSSALALLRCRDNGQGAGRALVSLAQVAEEFAASLRWGLTAPGGPLGGGLPNCNLYATRTGILAVAPLEPHFFARLRADLGCAQGSHEELQEVFLSRTAAEWEAWAIERDLPIAAVRPIPEEE